MTLGAPSAAVVSVGNELLFGETVDTNAAWLGRALYAFGIPVTRRFTVGDVAEEIEWAVRDAAAVADLVLITGGLGPTPDDLTKSVVANTFGLDLIFDQEVFRALRSRYTERGLDDVPVSAYGQAEVPEGATTLENPEGTAPGILLRVPEATVVLLPGVPRELQAIVEGALRPYLVSLQPGEGERIWHHVVHTTGIAESRLTLRIEERLAELDDGVRGRVGLAYLPDLHGVDLRFSAHGASQDEAMSHIMPCLEAIEGVVSPYRFEAPSGDLAEAVCQALRERNLTIATAESCTGGLIAKRLTDTPGSSDVFIGGVVAYSNDVKAEQVGVLVRDIEYHGSVSEPVARQLAHGIARRFGADVGVGVTGVAGPGGGSEEKPIGTVWIATCVGGDVQAFAGRYSGDRAAVRARAGQAALAAVHRRLVDAGRELNP